MIYSLNDLIKLHLLTVFVVMSL